MSSEIAVLLLVSVVWASWMTVVIKIGESK